MDANVDKMVPKRVYAAGPVIQGKSQQSKPARPRRWPEVPEIPDIEIVEDVQFIVKLEGGRQGIRVDKGPASANYEQMAYGGSVDFEVFHRSDHLRAATLGC